MGTRSFTTIYAAPNFQEPLVKLYRQFDGYPDGHGKELAEYLLKVNLVNGLSAHGKEDFTVVANGMDCLAAQLVAHFKTEPGQFYLAPLNGETEEFNYELCPIYSAPVGKGGKFLQLRVTNGSGKELFNNTINKFHFFIMNEIA